jgi:hypothetical protein
MSFASSPESRQRQHMRLHDARRGAGDQVIDGPHGRGDPQQHEGQALAGFRRRGERHVPIVTRYRQAMPAILASPTDEDKR